MLAVADALGAPVIKTLPGKAVIPDDSPFAVGGIGLLGTKPGEELMEDCDTLLMVGTNFPYTKHLPEPGKVRVVQIEADPTRVGRPAADRGAGHRRRQGVPCRAAAAARLATRTAAHLAKYQEAMDGLAQRHGGAGVRHAAIRSPRSTSSRCSTSSRLTTRS